jgi:hypothetical protein
LPLPLAPLVAVSHPASLAAVHAHPLPAVTLTVPLVAAELPDRVVDDKA